MSDIIGTGHGSEHDWLHDLTDTFGGESGSRYLCNYGDAVFVHLYDVTPDIFAAMKIAGVPEHCVGKQSPPSTHTSDGSPESTESAAGNS